MKSHELEFLTITGYNINSFYSRITNSGVGVIILSKNNLKAKNFKIKSLNLPSINQLISEKEFECCLIEFKCDLFSFVLAGVYRSPISDVNIFLTKLNASLEILSKTYTNVIITGDVNINVLDPSCNKFKLLKDTLAAHNFKHLVNFPTRVTENTESAIDNVFINFLPNSMQIIGLNTQISDHDAQLLTFEIPNKNINSKPITKTVRIFSSKNLQNFSNMLSKESWEEVYFAPVDLKFNVFNNIFMYYFNLCFPTTKCRGTDQKVPWNNYELESERKKMIEISTLGSKTKNKDTVNLAKEMNKTLKQNIFKAKQSYMNDKILSSTNVSKTTWNLINLNIKNKNNLKSIDEIEINSEVCTDPIVICNIFNDFYVNVVDSEVISNINPPNLSVPNFVIDNQQSKFRCEPISETDINKIISKFDNKLSSGFDDVPITVIKHARSSLQKPFAHLVNSSFISGIFPEKLKISKIKPLYKKGNQLDVSNYRPVALLPVMSKIYEKAMYIQLVNFLESNNLLDKEQHGFRSNHSVISAAATYIESIINSVDRGDKVIGIFMDLSKAFDSVSHHKLLSKLEGLGVVGTSLQWFRSYLTGRKQFVEIMHVNNHNQVVSTKSKLRTIKHGVPQGSILGPLLFLTYIKGLPNVISDITKNTICLYADDANLLVSGKSNNEIETSAINNLKSIKDFFSDHQLLLNLSKTNFTCFDTKTNTNSVLPTLQLDGIGINIVEKTKFLGLYIDNRLSWNYHIDHVANKISSGLFALYRLSKICNLGSLKLVYFSHIHSHLSFGISIYGGTSQTNMDRLLILQKKAIRIMLKLNWQESVKDKFKELGIMTVYSNYIYQCILHTVQNSKTVSLVGDFHQYFTRNRNNFSIPSHRLRFFEKTPIYMGMKSYNALPTILKNCTNFSKFKNNLKIYFLTKPLYSIDEFFL